MDGGGEVHWKEGVCRKGGGTGGGRKGYDYDMEGEMIGSKR